MQPLHGQVRLPFSGSMDSLFFILDEGEPRAPSARVEISVADDDSRLLDSYSRTIRNVVRSVAPCAVGIRVETARGRLGPNGIGRNLPVAYLRRGERRETILTPTLSESTRLRG